MTCFNNFLQDHLVRLLFLQVRRGPCQANFRGEVVSMATNALVNRLNAKSCDARSGILSIECYRAFPKRNIPSQI